MKARCYKRKNVEHSYHFVVYHFERDSMGTTEGMSDLFVLYSLVIQKTNHSTHCMQEKRELQQQIIISDHKKS